MFWVTRLDANSLEQEEAMTDYMGFFAFLAIAGVVAGFFGFAEESARDNHRAEFLNRCITLHPPGECTEAWQATRECE